MKKRSPKDRLAKYGYGTDLEGTEGIGKNVGSALSMAGIPGGELIGSAVDNTFGIVDAMLKVNQGYQKQPTMNRMAMRNMVTPYSSFAFGGSSGDGDGDPKLILTEEDKKAVAKDGYTRNIFGNSAEQIYAAGFKPKTYNGQLIYTDNSDLFTTKDKQRIGYMPTKNNKLSRVLINADGTYTGSDEYQMSADDVINDITRIHGQRLGQINANPAILANVAQQTMFGFGGEIDEDTMTQLQQMADENGVTVEDMLAMLQEDADNGGQEDEEQTEEVDNEEEESDEDLFAYGGIHIKAKNKGKFTASAKKAGMGVQQFASHVLANKSKYSGTLVKRANFARNASKWKHAYGGESNIEVEGNEVLETPDGQLTKVKGPSHESGGVDVTVPDKTKIYSDRLSVDGKTMQERKIARERSVKRLERLVDKNPADKILKTTYERVASHAAAEEEEDMQLQKFANSVLGQNGKAAFGYDGEDPNDPLGIKKIFTIDPMSVPLSNAPFPIDKPYEATKSNLSKPDLTVKSAAPVTVKRPVLSGKNTPNLNEEESDIDLTTGDWIGLAGNAFNAIAPMLNTFAAAKATKPNINRYKSFGLNALEENQKAQDAASKLKAGEMSDIETAANAARARSRNSTSSVNTLRALDAVTDMGVSKAKQGAEDSFEKTMMNLITQRGQLENLRDDKVMQGETRRDMADKMDTDNFFTNMAQNLTDFGTNVQGIGKNINTAHSNKVDKKLISQLSMYGLGFDDQGNLISI